MTKRFLVALLVVAGLLVSLVGCGTSAGTKNSSKTSKTPTTSTTSSTAGQPVVLKGVTAWTQSTQDTTGFFYFQKEVNANSKGLISVKYLGGPEVVPTFQLVNALKSGTVDIALTSMSYEASIAPEANIFCLDMHTPAQERADGFYALFNKIMAQKANARLLARVVPGQMYNLYTTFPVHSFADLKGKPIRTSGVYVQLVQALGASPLVLDPSQVYSALDRGVAKGYGWPGYGINTLGWGPLTKDKINPGFYQVDAVLLINSNKWNSLTDAQKKILDDAALDTEKAMGPQFQQFSATDQATLAKEGMKTVDLPADQFDKYVKAANAVKIGAVIKQSPEYGPEIQKLIEQ